MNLNRGSEIVSPECHLMNGRAAEMTAWQPPLPSKHDAIQTLVENVIDADRLAASSGAQRYRAGEIPGNSGSGCHHHRSADI